MSVLIKGIKMPQACFWRDKNDSLIICPLYDADGYCGADGKQRCLVPENEMPNDCPIIELPPHGDLISKERLVDIGLYLMNIAKNEDIANGVKWLWQYVIEAQTILEAEEGET